MTVTNIVVFDDTEGIHTIGIDEAEAAISLMREHAEANGLPEPGPRAHFHLHFRACENVSVSEDQVAFRRVSDIAPGARRLFTWDAEEEQTGDDDFDDE